jgi:hypothetical protein
MLTAGRGSWHTFQVFQRVRDGTCVDHEDNTRLPDGTGSRPNDCANLVARETHDREKETGGGTTT